MTRTIDSEISSRRNNFDFIRFLAATLVIFSHSYDLTGLYKDEPFRIFSKGYMSLGTLAVVIFFSISGFLIARSYDNSASLKKYVLARIFRIYPALIVTTFVTILFLGPILTHESLLVYWKSSETYKYLLNSFSVKIQYHLPGVFKTNKIQVVNGSLWSLPYEISCYCLIALYGQVRERKMLNAIVIAILVLVFYYAIGFSLIVNIIQYTFFFMCGSLYYVFRKKIYLNHFLSFGFIIILALSIYFNISNHIKDFLIGLLLPYIILCLVYTKSIFNSFSKYGDFSYGLYILAMPVQQTLINFYSNITHYYNFIFSFIITLFCAIISWHLVEKRALRYKTFVK